MTQVNCIDDRENMNITAIFFVTFQEGVLNFKFYNFTVWHITTLNPIFKMPPNT